MTTSMVTWLQNQAGCRSGSIAELPAIGCHLSRSCMLDTVSTYDQVRSMRIAYLMTGLKLACCWCCWSMVARALLAGAGLQNEGAIASVGRPAVLSATFVWALCNVCSSDLCSKGHFTCKTMKAAWATVTHIMVYFVARHSLYARAHCSCRWLCTTLK